MPTAGRIAHVTDRVSVILLFRGSDPVEGLVEHGGLGRRETERGRGVEGLHRRPCLVQDLSSRVGEGEAGASPATTRARPNHEPLVDEGSKKGADALRADQDPAGKLGLRQTLVVLKLEQYGELGWRQVHACTQRGEPQPHDVRGAHKIPDEQRFPRHGPIVSVTCLPMEEDKMRVSVVGAGIGGLALAQGLHGAGIEVAAYDKDSHVGAGGGLRIC